MDLKNKKSSGLTLVELLLAIAIVAILAAVTTVGKFPSAEELRIKKPEDAMREVLYEARKLAVRYGRPMRIHVYDNAATLNIAELFLGANSGNSLANASDPEECKNVAKFINEIASLRQPITEQTLSSITTNVTTRTPLMLVTDETNRIVLDHGAVVYCRIQNPQQNNQNIEATISSDHQFFAPALTTTTSEGQSYSASRSHARPYMTLYPTGVGEHVEFLADRWGPAGSKFEITTLGAIQQ